jgi:SIT4-associating protein SAP185/190
MLKGGNPLTVGVGIVIEVIRKNNSDYDPDIGTGVESIPSSRDPIYLGTLLRLFATHVPDFMNLVSSQGTVTVTDDDGTKKEIKRELKVAFGGAIEPLGFDRFKTCELMAELLHCSNMGLLNEKGGERYVKDRDRERDRLKAERLLAAEGLGDSGGGTEGVVVEKAPLQVQNGGIEMSDDGLNEEEFEDVIVSDMLEEAIEGHPNLDKKDYCEDGFVEEPLPLLSPTAQAEEDTANSSSAAAGPAPQDISAPVGAPISADDILTPNEPPVGVVAAADVPLPADNEVHEQAESNDVDMGEAPPPLPPKDDGSAPTAPAREVVLTEEEVPVPKAPSPPVAEGADETDRETGRSMVDYLESETALSPLNPTVSPERMDEELPSLPTLEATEGVSQNAPQPEEENLLDLNSTPDTTIAEGDVSVRSLGSVGSSITEYQAMIEPDLDGNPVVGDYLKMMFVEHKVVPTILVCCMWSALQALAD